MPSWVTRQISLLPSVSTHSDEVVAFLEVDGDDAVLAVVAESLSAVFFTVPSLVAKKTKPALADHMVSSSASLARRGGARAAIFSSGRRLSTFLMLRPLAVREPSGSLIHALDIHAAGVGEEQQVVVRLRAEEMLDEIVRLVLARWPRGSPCP